jgi:hypothetical protein
MSGTCIWETVLEDVHWLDDQPLGSMVTVELDIFPTPITGRLLSYRMLEDSHVQFKLEILIAIKEMLLALLPDVVDQRDFSAV